MVGVDRVSAPGCHDNGCHRDSTAKNRLAHSIEGSFFTMGRYFLTVSPIESESNIIEQRFAFLVQILEPVLPVPAIAPRHPSIA
jgi:hypothetical protein